MKITEIYIIGALVFVTIFFFARQSIEEQHINARISRLAEMKMAIIDDLNVQEVEIAALDSAPRIERAVFDMKLPLRPATQLPLVISVQQDEAAPSSSGSQGGVEVAHASGDEDRS